jgi:hypothetical protein
MKEGGKTVRSTQVATTPRREELTVKIYKDKLHCPVCNLSLKCPIFDVLLLHKSYILTPCIIFIGKSCPWGGGHGRCHKRNVRPQKKKLANKDDIRGQYM